jgi:hypothetical protein
MRGVYQFWGLILGYERLPQPVERGHNGTKSGLAPGPARWGRNGLTLSPG